LTKKLENGLKIKGGKLYLKIKRIYEKIKKRLEWFFKSPKEYAFYIREIEKILELPHIRIIPWFDEGFCPYGEGAFLRPILWPFWRETPPQVTPLQVAIHEVRHLLQVKYKVRLITIEEVKDLTIFKEEIEKQIDKLKKEGELFHLEEEIDALIVEVLGRELLTQKKIKEFKNLMLNSILPTSFLLMR